MNKETQTLNLVMNCFKSAVTKIQKVQDECKDAINLIELDLFKTALNNYDTLNWHDGLSDEGVIELPISDEFTLYFYAVIPNDSLLVNCNESGLIDSEPCYITEIGALTFNGDKINYTAEIEELIFTKFND